MPARQLNPQHPAPHQQHRKKNLEHLSPDRMKKDMEELIPVGSKHPKSSVFQYTTRVEGSSYSSVARAITTTSSKHLPKHLSSRLQLN